MNKLYEMVENWLEKRFKRPTWPGCPPNNNNRLTMTYSRKIAQNMKNAWTKPYNPEFIVYVWSF